MSIFNKKDNQPLIARYEEAKAAYTHPTDVVAYTPKAVTDIQYAANSLCQLCHLDMASLCEYVWGEQPPTSRHDLADRIAAWADTHRSDRNAVG